MNGRKNTIENNTDIEIDEDNNLADKEDNFGNSNAEEVDEEEEELEFSGGSKR